MTQRRVMWRARRLPKLSSGVLAALLVVALSVAADEPAPESADQRPPDEANRAAKSRQPDQFGEAWRQTMGGLDQWFSTQPIYDPQEAAELKQRIVDRAQNMSADEREAFQQDLAAKLEMVLGPEGRDILGWTAAMQAAATPAFRKQMGLDYPDITRLSAAQLRELLDRLERKRARAKGQSAAFERSRQARIAALQSEQRQQFQERERALDRGARANAGYRSPYHPHGIRQYPEEVVRPPYGFGWGFGFW